MRSLIALILVGILGTVVWNYKKPKPRNDSSFIDSSKYPAITYPNNPDSEDCKDENGLFPDATVASDFDGDGKLDRVRIAKKDATHDVLVVWLSTKGYVPAELEEIKDPGSMTISLAKAGETIESACSKGYFECKEEDLEEVKLKHDGFWYVKCGEAASVFYWNAEKAVLDRMWTSD